MPPGVRPPPKPKKSNIVQPLPAWVRQQEHMPVSHQASTPPPGGYAAWLQGQTTPGEGAARNFGPSGGNNRGGGRSGGGGGGGGGGGAAADAARRAAVDQAFTLDESPYWHMQAALDKQRGQAAAYQPGFDASRTQALARGQEIEGQRGTMIQQRLAELRELGASLAGQQGTALGNATRDLQGQGFNPQQYIGQANQMGADRTAGLGNIGQYLTMLNMNQGNANADFQRGVETIHQGGVNTLANNQLALNNSLDMQGAGIQQQAAQARLENQKAKLQYMIQAGLV